MLLALFGFVILVLSIGLLAGRKQDAEGYNVYNRRLSLPNYIVSFSAGQLGAGLFIVGTAYVYSYGLALLWLVVGAIVGYIVFGIYSHWLKNKTTELGAYTMADYVRARFGSSAAKLVAWVVVILYAMDIAIQFVGGAKLLSQLGVLSFTGAVLLTGCVVAIYLLYSGYRAVVWTDYILFGTVLALTTFLALHARHTFTFSTETLWFSKSVMWEALGFFAYGLFISFASPINYQRIYAGGSTKVIRWGTAIGSILLIMPATAILLMGLAARHAFPGLQPDTVFVHIIQSSGAALQLFGMIVLWAGLMCQIDTVVFVGGQALSRDIFRSSMTKGAVRVSIIAMLVMGAIICFAFPSITKLTFVYMAGFTMLAPIMLVQWWTNAITNRVATTSIVCGLIGIFTWIALREASAEVILAGFFAAVAGLVVSLIISKFYKSLKAGKYFGSVVT
jgi:solute:Na+ symporter, SSS family